MLSDDSKAHYEFVLKDLTTRKSDHQKEVVERQKAIRELDVAISGIARLLDVEAPKPPIAAIVTTVVPVPALLSQKPIGHRYATVSTRWAILDLLDRASVPLSASDIAQALLDEGLPTRAEKFVNNVSAVLSDMKSPRVEVDSKDGKWEITERGRDAINHIRRSRRIMLGDLRTSVKTEAPDATTSSAS